MGHCRVVSTLDSTVGGGGASETPRPAVWGWHRAQEAIWSWLEFTLMSIFDGWLMNKWLAQLVGDVLLRLCYSFIFNNSRSWKEIESYTNNKLQSLVVAREDRVSSGWQPNKEIFYRSLSHWIAWWTWISADIGPEDWRQSGLMTWNMVRACLINAETCGCSNKVTSVINKSTRKNWYYINRSLALV